MPVALTSPKPPALAVALIVPLLLMVAPAARPEPMKMPAAVALGDDVAPGWAVADAEIVPVLVNVPPIVPVTPMPAALTKNVSLPSTVPEIVPPLVIVPFESPLM